MIQLLLIGCFGLLAMASIALVVSLIKFLAHGTDLRTLVISSSFLAGFLIVGWLIWSAAMPDGWTLPFWTTLRATVDSQTYGHTIEHAAEVLASKAIILGAGGGLLAAGLAWIAGRKSKFGPAIGV